MKNNASHTIDSVFTVVLFALFALVTMFVTASGAAAYRSVSEQSEMRYERQTCINYITAKIRAYNAAEIGEIDGSSALIFTDEYESGSYSTYIYYYDGSVRELVCRSDIQPDINAGTALIDAAGLSFAKSDELITINLTNTNETDVQAYVHVIS